MPAPRTTGLALVTAACGTVALVMTTSLATPAPAAPPHITKTAVTRPAAPAAPAGLAAPAPDALRRAAADAVKTIDNNAITAASTTAAQNCDAAQPAPQKDVRDCAAVKENLTKLTTARAALQQQATAAAPDVNAIAGATTGAVGATAQLARNDLSATPDTRNANGHFGGGGLLSVATRLVGGLVEALHPAVYGVTALLDGLLRTLLT
ncbi:hypothetical protein ACH427_23360 [Streptomyces sp. NPDC020379]|uniref:hypothetical protein n=1 Tax=Streptomyces sp. NPDC020379 TaxID=3365071 RepID=UPI003798AAEB